MYPTRAQYLYSMETVCIKQAFILRYLKMEILLLLVMDHLDLIIQKDIDMPLNPRNNTYSTHSLKKANVGTRRKSASRICRDGERRKVYNITSLIDILKLLITLI